MDLTLRIANHCAPALVGIKPSNLIATSLATRCSTLEEIRELNEQLNPAGIFFRCLRENHGPVLFLVYRKNILERHLNDTQVRTELACLGYPVCAGLESLLNELERRLEGETFPHEIAYFLGYPVADIHGYMECKGRDCRLSGYWKVYDNPDAAARTFACYTGCRKVITDCVKAGKKLNELFGTRLQASNRCCN